MLLRLTQQLAPPVVQVCMLSTMACSAPCHLQYAQLPNRYLYLLIILLTDGSTLDPFVNAIWWMADDVTTQNPEGSTAQSYNASDTSGNNMANSTNQTTVTTPRVFVGPVVIIDKIVSIF